MQGSEVIDGVNLGAERLNKSADVDKHLSSDTWETPALCLAAVVPTGWFRPLPEAQDLVEAAQSVDKPLEVVSAQIVQESAKTGGRVFRRAGENFRPVLDPLSGSVENLVSSASTPVLAVELTIAGDRDGEPKRRTSSRDDAMTMAGAVVQSVPTSEATDTATRPEQRRRPCRDRGRVAGVVRCTSWQV